MNEKKKHEIPIPFKLDDFFTTQEVRDEESKEKIEEIDLSLIDDFKEHPFKVIENEELINLENSIKQNGVLSPVIVRKKDNGRYEMISGHRRKFACNRIGYDKIPCIIKDLSNDEATIYMVDSNLQREELLPSEKAFAYKMKLEAMKRQGQRTDLTSDPLGQKLKGRVSVEFLSDNSNDSKTQIQRYIRLTNLTTELLDMVDEGKIAIRPAVELSYLSTDEQRTLLDTMLCEACTPSHAQAIKMRRFSEAGNLTEQVILSIIQEEKPNQKEQFKMPKERIAKFFPAGTPAQKMEETIVKALEYYRKRQRDMER